MNLEKIVGARHPMLLIAGKHIFDSGGKRIRPLILFLVARATAEMQGMHDITDEHRRLAEITELIHTASLMHDDVLDDSNMRRGKQTINSKFGIRVAVLSGDFFFAQACWLIANLNNLEVIKLMSQVIADFANGEINQANTLYDTTVTLQQYLDKSFCKTASLMAASCQSAAVFSDASPAVTDAMCAYGKHLGLAFQIVDDILDFTQNAEQLGKPQGQDLASGNLTAPVIFALRNESLLEELIQSRFVKDGSLMEAITLVYDGNGIEEAKNLARKHADLALKTLDCLPETQAKSSLQLMVEYVLNRVT